MKKIFHFFGRSIYWLWKFLTTGCLIFTNLVFLAVILLILSVFFEPEVTVPDGSALILEPTGDIVETTTAISPISRMINGFAGVPIPRETLLQDIIDVIHKAANDKRIKLLVLSLAEMEGSSMDQLDAIGQAVDSFKQTGKKVIAVDDHYSQGTYYLASYADEIYLNPMGSVDLRGFSVFRLYMKELIDKLAINFHIFKVGTFKSATEPLLRNDMSEQAKMANRLWLTKLWDRYCHEIAGRRGLKTDFFNTYINDMPHYLRQAQGSMSKMALQAKLVDGIKTRHEITEYLISLVGTSKDKKSFNGISFNDYLRKVTPSFTSNTNGTDKVGLIVAQGNIMYGKEVAGQIGSEYLCELIREARQDENIKALVLRIDSGGGSAIASEQIRRELVLFQQTGKPFVVSMGSMAASGAYWISAPADRIIASPSTLTGSIGIFGIMPTFEDSITKIGVHSDGISTTRIAGAGNLTVPLSEELSETMQLSIEEGYDRFLTVVADGRHMPKSQVEKIAEGRVWDGMTAKDLGLIDQHGNLQEAIQAAAEIANLEKYETVYVEEMVSTGNEFLRQLGMESSSVLERFKLAKIPFQPFLAELNKQFDISLFTNDPNGMYAHSLLPYPAVHF